jgi:hypothetical protein
MPCGTAGPSAAARDDSRSHGIASGRETCPWPSFRLPCPLRTSGHGSTVARIHDASPGLQGCGCEPVRGIGAERSADTTEAGKTRLTCNRGNPARPLNGSIETSSIGSGPRLVSWASVARQEEAQACLLLSLVAGVALLSGPAFARRVLASATIAPAVSSSGQPTSPLPLPKLWPEGSGPAGYAGPCTSCHGMVRCLHRAP